MRLTERYMDPRGRAMPDCLIAARLANAMEAVWREKGDDATADKFAGFDWQTEEDAFMDGYHQVAGGGEFVTYDLLRTMGTNGFQEPATAVENGTIVGTKRLYADGKFGTEDGRATFMATEWRGLQAPGKQAQKDTFPYLINNGRANVVWQSAYLDQEDDFVMDRWPLPFLEMHPDDMTELGVADGDLVEVWNDGGSTQAMVYPTPTARDLHALRLPDRGAGQRGQRRGERVHHPQLQADLGQHPPPRRQTAVGRPPNLQVEGIPGSLRAPSARRCTSPWARALCHAEAFREPVLRPAGPYRSVGRGGCAGVRPCR
jgi:arsenite oxidase large subunit